MEIIQRPRYLNHIISHLNKGMMIILVGQRRVGKSFMLLQLQEWLKSTRPQANVLYIDKEKAAFKEMRNWEHLYDYVSARLPEGGDNYLLIDEVQDIEEYENALRSLYAEGRCQIVTTGSNAYIFSSELSTRLSGRYIEIPIYNLSYSEFLRFHHLEDSDSSLKDFLRIGGLPGLSNYGVDAIQQISDYLQGVFNTIMFRDVVARENIRNAKFVDTLAKYIADNVGKPISSRNIANAMKSQGEKIADTTVSAYLDALGKALLVKPVYRFDIHGKKLFEQNDKYYFSDHGLRNLLMGFDVRRSIEKIIENVIYLFLLQQGYKVTVGVLQKGEVDFVATRMGETVYIQATYILASEETIRREFGNLAAISDNYPKYVISMDPISGELEDYPGIKSLNLREFLMSDF